MPLRPAPVIKVRIRNEIDRLVIAVD